MPRDFIPGRREPEIPSNTFSYFFREALRRLWVSKRTSFVAVAMIAISLLIVGTFLLVAENLGRAAEEWQGQIARHRLSGGPTPRRSRSRTSIAGWPANRTWPSGTSSRASRRWPVSAPGSPTSRKWSARLDENPFPASFEVDVEPSLAQSAAFHQNITTLRTMSGVDQVQYDWEWIARLRRVVNVINIAGLVAGGILAVAAAFTIANVIRLTMMLYREEIEIMRLVGATERIIRGPFLIEGFLQGTLGGLLSIVLLFAAYETARHALSASSSILWGFLFTGFLPGQKIAALVAGGMLAGWFGSWLSVRERTDD